MSARQALDLISATALGSGPEQALRLWRLRARQLKTCQGRCPYSDGSGTVCDLKCASCLAAKLLTASFQSYHGTYIQAAYVVRDYVIREEHILPRVA